ncbi:fumarate hydrolyase [Photobacterium gaetbulicola]|uniref:Putative extracellular lipase n=1 Tax=Photobacterium gaetbulicola Gung47 TaxID=658445 RepID=A0A0C5WNV4_9GAMM|nr:VolA/Pla-1 family phospholipase [Photobacterium gaetbulicola]AJR08057.1 putative extracellular lipase [Photobacterium gaetbulicola Gung47]PSU12947.1 fumarate hydrolyase [Photobacterium gaetbulicola]
MNKSILALSIAASLALAGCGNDAKVENKVSYEDHIAKSLEADTKIKFDILTAPILPTFLAMDSTDGTLSTEGSVGDENYKTDLSDPLTALGKTDGWSVSQPIVLPFDGKLDAASALDAFHLIETTSPLAGAPQLIKVLERGPLKDYLLVPGDGKITIFPNSPLNPKSNYMFALTDSLLDSEGEPVGMSESYAALKTTVKPPSSDLIGAQKVTHAIEATVAAVKGIEPNSIIYSSWFTTGSVGDVLDTTKAVIAQTIGTVQAGGKAEDILKGEANPNNIDLSSLYQMNISEVTDIETFFNNSATLRALVSNDQDTIDDLVAGYVGNGIKVYTGTVSLPNFLNSNTENEAWKKTPWQSAVPSLAKISNVMTNGSDADKAAVQASLDGIDIAKLLGGDSAEFIKLIGLKVTLADGSQLDEERLVTQYSPLPQIQSVDQVPVLMIVPPAALAPTPGVVVYQHGITSVKETAYLFGAQHIGAAAATSAVPKAIVAIDHPLHGERALADGTVTTGETADVYMNLEYLNVARDNIRQSIIDDLGLRTSLSVMAGSGLPTFPSLNVMDVSFFGHSLGAISGIGTYRLGNKTLGIDEADALFNFTSGAFANPGGGIPSLLLESKTFGPTIKHSLMLGAEDAAYLGACGGAEDGAACFATFYDSLDETTQAKVDGTFTAFAYAAQTVLDTIDPYNLGRDVEGPVYVMQAANDSVIPNQTTKYGIIGGTEPLAKQLGLADLKNYSSGEVAHIARFNIDSKAQHSTVIGPQLVDGEGTAIDPVTAQAATDQAQLQVATFSANAGQGIVVTRPDMIN